MKVLVTGTAATSGRCWCRSSARPGTRSSASTPAGTTGATSVRSPRTTSHAPVTSATSGPRTSPASTPWCNLAAISNDPVGHLNPDATYSVNAHGAAHLARVAKEAGVPRYLFSSSCSLYGAAGDAPVTEESDFNPVTPYGESKVMAEQLIAQARGRRLQPDLPAQRDGVRLVAAAARRHRGQQPDRHGVHPRRGAAAERRLAVASAGARRGHLARLPRGARGRPRGRARPGVQRRARRGRRADPRHRPRGGASGSTSRSPSPRAPSPDKRDYRVDFGKVTRLLPGLPARAGRCRTASRSWPPTWSATA